MNTNLVVAILFSLSTNWTGFNDGAEEIGIVKSNTVAQIVYDGLTNAITLKSEHTGMYVLRPAQQHTNTYIHWGELSSTGEYHLPIYTNIVVTNTAVPCLEGSGGVTMKAESLTWNKLAAALCRAGVIPFAAIDDAEGYDNCRTLDAVKAAAEMLREILCSDESENG